MAILILTNPILDLLLIFHDKELAFKMFFCYTIRNF